MWDCCTRFLWVGRSSALQGQVAGDVFSTLQTAQSTPCPRFLKELQPLRLSIVPPAIVTVPVWAIYLLYGLGHSYKSCNLTQSSSPKMWPCVCSTCLGSRWTQNVLNHTQPQHPIPSIPRLCLHHLGNKELDHRSRISWWFSNHSRETVCIFLACICLCVEDSFLL